MKFLVYGAFISSACKFAAAEAFGEGTSGIQGGRSSWASEENSSGVPLMRPSGIPLLRFGEFNTDSTALLASTQDDFWSVGDDEYVPKNGMDDRSDNGTIHHHRNFTNWTSNVILGNSTRIIPSFGHSSLSTYPISPTTEFVNQPPYVSSKPAVTTNAPPHYKTRNRFFFENDGHLRLGEIPTSFPSMASSVTGSSFPITASHTVDSTTVSSSKTHGWAVVGEQLPKIPYLDTSTESIELGNSEIEDGLTTVLQITSSAMWRNSVMMHSRLITPPPPPPSSQTNIFRTKNLAPSGSSSEKPLLLTTISQSNVIAESAANILTSKEKFTSNSCLGANYLHSFTGVIYTNSTRKVLRYANAVSRKDYGYCIFPLGLLFLLIAL